MKRLSLLAVTLAMLAVTIQGQTSDVSGITVYPDRWERNCFVSEIEGKLILCAKAHEIVSFDIASQKLVLPYPEIFTRLLVGQSMTNLVNDLAKSGDICRVKGHSWGAYVLKLTSEDGKTIDVTFDADVFPFTKNWRTCRICGKCESKSEGEWK
ncbi:MAG: hypothetical protein WC497_05510 [Patescibacteria group bacterium]